eukprot:jgi/Orpsp1_1/1178556/evm.model.c7180000065824.2
MTRKNFTTSIEDSNIMIESLLKKKNNKYDLYFYDNAYSKKYCSYLLDLNKKLPENHIEMFDEYILSQTSRCQNKIVGLPITLATNALYSNKKLLDKYHKDIPKTWDELITTSKEILEKERALNNTELIGYNGLLFDSEEGICSIYEFIYSCRESYESSFPDLRSQTTINAMGLLKKIKEDISSDEIFRSNMEYSYQKLFNGNALFIKFWVFIAIFLGDHSPYVVTGLPGIKEGLSGSILAGYNIGIDSSIDNSKKESAIEVIRYMTSKEFQKSLVLKQIIISGILSLYDDEEVCSSIKYCDYYKKIQTVAKPTDKMENFKMYSEKFTYYFYKYLYEDEEASYVLKQIEDITKIYHISLDSKETFIGIIVFIIFFISLILILLSFSILYLNKYEYIYLFLSKPIWFMIILGIVMILSKGFTKFGIVTSFKCHLNNILFSLGYTFITIPILKKLIILFPDKNNKYSQWINQNKYLFFIIFILLDVIFNGLTFIYPYNIIDININEGENFQICKAENLLTLSMISIIYIYKILILLAILLFTFMEWNIKATKYDIRFIVSFIYINIITFIFAFIFNYFQINNYILNFIIKESIIYILSISNYISLYGIRILYAYLFKTKKYLIYLEKAELNDLQNKKQNELHMNDTFQSSLININSITTNDKEIILKSNDNDTILKANNNETLQQSNSFYSKLIYYHYLT